MDELKGLEPARAVYQQRITGFWMVYELCIAALVITNVVLLLVYDFGTVSEYDIQPRCVSVPNVW